MRFKGRVYLVEFKAGPAMADQGEGLRGQATGKGHPVWLVGMQFSRNMERLKKERVQ